MGYCKKTGDKKYKIRYDVPPANGKERQLKTETLKNVTKQQAEAILADRKKAVAAGDQAHDFDKTFGELCDHFMDRKRAVTRKPKAPKTLEGYEGMINTHLRPSLGKMKLRDLRVHHLNAAYSVWEKKKAVKRDTTLSATTVKHLHDLVRNILNCGVKWGWIVSNPALQIESDDLPEVSAYQATVLAVVELKKLLAEAKMPTSRSLKRGYLSAYSAFYPALAFAAYTGSRRGECLAVKWDGLDFEAGTAWVSESLTQTKGGLIFKSTKNGKARRVSLSDQLVAILKERRQTQNLEKAALGQSYRDQNLVFATPDGGPFTPWNFGAAFADLVKRADVPRVRLHDLDTRT